jgi:hypothetical protein
VEEEKPTLLLAHASIDLSPAASATAALLHLDEPRAHTILGDGSSNDKTDGWCLDTGATHHMTGRWEFFTELDYDVQGSIKFGDASGVEIKGVGSVIFIAESGEHKLLIGVHYIPALRNSIISLGRSHEDLGSPLLPSCQGNQRHQSTLRPKRVGSTTPFALLLVEMTRRGSGMSDSGTFNSRS